MDAGVGPQGTYEQLGLDRDTIQSFDALEVACIENENQQNVHVPQTVGVATFSRCAKISAVCRWEFDDAMHLRGQCWSFWHRVILR